MFGIEVPVVYQAIMFGAVVVGSFGTMLLYAYFAYLRVYGCH